MEQIVETILGNLPVGLLVIGSDGKVIEANPSACRILGCSAQGFVGKSWGDIFFSQESNLEFTNVVLDAIQNVKPVIERVTPYFSPDGDKKYLSVISSTERQGGSITAIVVIIEDLTELHGLHEREKRILAQNHELAQERAASLVSFASSVAHQIRNPIMAIAGFSRLIKRKVGETIREPVEAIEEETAKLETMVRSVAEYSAISMENVSLVNVWTIMEDARKRLVKHPAAESTKVTWETECPDMNIRADRPLLSCALAEILINSLEFGGDSVTLGFRIQEMDERVEMVLSDDGPGMTEAGLGMAFDPFYTTKPIGAGMGLTRAKRIVGEHQGRIRIQHGASAGVEVLISLPLDGI